MSFIGNWTVIGVPSNCERGGEPNAAAAVAVSTGSRDGVGILEGAFEEASENRGSSRRTDAGLKCLLVAPVLSVAVRFWRRGIIDLLPLLSPVLARSIPILDWLINATGVETEVTEARGDGLLV